MPTKVSSKKTEAKYEETHHYNGEATVKFYPGMHGYFVTDSYPDPTDPKKTITLKNQRMGGGTSLTGVMSKGQGLMLYPMYEMRKFLKQYARSHTLEDIFDSPQSFEDLLREACNAHVRKSDRGKSVGTDAHAWVETHLRNMMRWQEMTEEQREAEDMDYPEIPGVDSIVTRLRASYVDMFKASNLKNIDPADPAYSAKIMEEYRKLPKLLMADSEIQEAMHIEATMLHKSTTAARQWFEIHDVYVHGTEDTVYSRELGICGKYDADLSVTCTKRCNWCFANGDEEKVIDILNEQGEDYGYTGRYIVDFKSTNASKDAPKGVYPEYLAQCGVYDLAKTEEFPDLLFDGHLILNGSKNDGSFNTHFSFERDRNVAWARLLSGVKEHIYQATKEVKASA